MHDITTKKKYINVNTKFRPFVKGAQEKNTDFIIDLPSPIRNVLSMKLKSFSAPDTEYTFSVSESNNSFEVVSGNGSTTTTVSVLPGKYTMETLDKLLDSVNAQIIFLGIELEYDVILQKFRFKGANIGGVELNFDVQNSYIYETFGWTLGFKKSYYSNKIQTNYPDKSCPKNMGNLGGITVINGVQYYLADSPVMLPNTSLYYMLYVDDFLNNMEDAFYEGCFPSNNNIKNVLAKVTTKYAYSNNTFYETDTDASFERVYSGPVTLNKLHIKLFDDNNKIVDFNNSDYTFLLEIIAQC